MRKPTICLNFCVNIPSSLRICIRYFWQIVWLWFCIEPYFIKADILGLPGHQIIHIELTSWSSYHCPFALSCSPPIDRLSNCPKMGQGNLVSLMKIKLVMTHSMQMGSPPPKRLNFHLNIHWPDPLKFGVQEKNKLELLRTCDRSLQGIDQELTSELMTKFWILISYKIQYSYFRLDIACPP